MRKRSRSPRSRISKTPINARTALQQLDNLPSLANRPLWSDAERSELQALMNLTQAETSELNQAGFSQLDAQYLSECLLIRSAVGSLRLESRPPLEQARLSFEWVCRMVYIEDLLPWPANPWMVLQSGYGVSLSHAYSILAVWQQLGLSCCLIGPPNLKESQSLVLDSTDPSAPATYAPFGRVASRSTRTFTYSITCRASQSLRRMERES